MRYSSQIDNVKSLEWGLNLQEAYVFSFLYSAPSWASEVILKGKVYYFVSRNLACKEIALYTDKPDTMYRCYKALESKGVVKFIKIEGKDCVMITKKGKDWNKKIESESDYSENNPNKLGKLSETDSENNPTYKSTILYKSKEEEEKGNPPSFVLKNREKAKATKKAYESRINFKDAENPISELETFINTNLIDKLNKYPSFSQMKHKEEFIKDFSEKAITKDWNDSDDLTLHLSHSIKLFTPKELPKVKRATVKYVYKINGSEFRHSDTKKFEMDKRNFENMGFEEIRVNA